MNVGDGITTTYTYKENNAPRPPSSEAYETPSGIGYNDRIPMGMQYVQGRTVQYNEMGEPSWNDTFAVVYDSGDNIEELIPETGDFFTDGNYIYRYNMYFTGSNESYDEYRLYSWTEDPSMNGWGVALIDATPDQVPTIATHVHHEPVVSLSSTFYGLGESTKMENLVIPSSVRDLSFAFSSTYATDWPEKIVIPPFVEDMTYTFSGAYFLDSEIVLYAEPTLYDSCFMDSPSVYLTGPAPYELKLSLAETCFVNYDNIICCLDGQTPEEYNNHVHSGTIPVGASYTTGRTLVWEEDPETFDFIYYWDDSNAVTYLAGEEFPPMASLGDIYTYGDYVYEIPMDQQYNDFWDLSWKVSVSDPSKPFYGDILYRIAGAPVKDLTGTFQNCTELVTAPLLPVEAENISYTFAGCASLGGVVYLPALPTSYTSCFAGTRAIIRVMGCVDSATSEAIAATAEEGNVCFYPSQYTGSNLINQSTTGTVVESVSEGGFTTSYTYDANGNILSITRVNDATNEVVDTKVYRYDGKNQLVFEGTSETVGTTYTYDNNGNILSKTDANGNVTVYSYTDPTWGDLLTSFNGEAISYDAIGNPLNWRGGATLTWKDGRKLSTYTKAGQTYTYLYDGEGYRVGKTVGNTVYEYTVVDGIIYAETRTTGSTATTLHYLFDDSGLRIGFVLNGTTTYYYRFNLQGDVTGIYDTSGNLIAEYTYDAWGNPLTVTGSDLTIANLNPIRYRGYYYDVETGLYHLMSRYYDPVVGRFISADKMIPANGESVQGYNLFVYCFNNPVNMEDETGNWPKWAKKLVAAVAVVAVVAVVATVVTVATGGVGTLACVAVGAAKGAAVGFAVGAATGVAEGAISHRISTGSWEGAGEAALNGMADGALTGSITGTVTGGMNSNVCFVAGTAVLSSIGFVAIETIRVGDKVWAENPETGDKGLKVVVRTFENETDHLVHVFVTGEKIVTTPEHPFYSPVKGWTAACKLRAGDILVSVNGEYVVVEKIQHEILETPITVYNFEVADFHTYFVGSNSVLVHNICGNSGSYEIFTPDQVYVGKGSEQRMAASIKRLATQGYEIVSSTWEPAANNTIAFIDEYMKMAKYGFDFGGKLINKIMSPGAKFFELML